MRVPKGPVQEQNEGGSSFCGLTLDRVVLWGNHAFADSANNGRSAKALVGEFIPDLTAVPYGRRPTARFLTGIRRAVEQLWLQVAQSRRFRRDPGAIARSVDFRDFQRINMLPAWRNMYRDEAGNRRPPGADGDKVVLWYDDFDPWKRSWFGGSCTVSKPSSASGPRWPTHASLEPQHGGHRHRRAEAWKKYDIRLVLEARRPSWPRSCGQAARASR